MKVSTKGRYALRVMLDLALNHTGDYIPLKDIAKRQQIAVKYLEQIIAQLGRAGLIRSARGAGGGHCLLREAKDYTAGEVLRAVEGDIRVVACLEGEENTCPRQEECLTLPFWKGLTRTINEYMDGVTLEDFIKGEIK